MTYCPYGKLFIPKGSAYDSAGLKIHIQDDNTSQIINFIHSQDVYLESGEKFVSVTEIINTTILPKKIKLYSNTVFIISNIIKLTIKNKNTKKVIASKYLGQKNQTNTIPYIEFSSPVTIDLNNDAIILEIDSLNSEETDPCCDKLPSQIIISDVPREVGGGRFLCVPLEQYYVLPTTTTTTTSPPFVIDFLTHPSNKTINLDSVTTLSFSAISTNDIDFTYWFEVSKNNGASWSKISSILNGKSRQVHSLLIQASSEKNNFKYRVVILTPITIISNIATLNIVFPTTTTTTAPPCIAVETTPPPPELNAYYVSGASEASDYDGVYCFYDYNYPLTEDPYVQYPIYEHVSGNKYIYLDNSNILQWLISDSLTPGEYSVVEYFTTPIMGYLSEGNVVFNDLPSQVVPSGDWYSRPASSGYLVSGAFPIFFNGMYYASGSLNNHTLYKHESENSYIYFATGGLNLWYVGANLGAVEDNSYGFYHYDDYGDPGTVPKSGWYASTPDDPLLEIASGNIIVYPDPSTILPIVVPSSCPTFGNNKQYNTSSTKELDEDIQL